MNKAHEAAISRIHPDPLLRLVFTEGEKSLWTFANDLFPDWILILDVIQVAAKVWLAVHLYYKQKSPHPKE